jgi:hypothetical protein
MPEYLSPGVYVEEIELGAKPIEGVSTSTTGFLGETERGPTAPTLVTSWLQYQRIFGSYFDANKYLPYAVEGFFKNGGQRCYIARIVKSSATTASVTLLTDDDREALKIDAIGEGEWGNRIAIKVSRNANGTFKISVFYWKSLPRTLYDPEIDTTTMPHPVVEVFNNLSLDEKSPDYYEKKVNKLSNLIKITKAVNIDEISGITEIKELSGTAKGGSKKTITLADETASKVEDPTGMWINIIGGTGKKQGRKIKSYNKTTKEATVEPDWSTQPDNTSGYKLCLFQLLENGVDQSGLEGLARKIDTADPHVTTTIKFASDASDVSDYYKDMNIAIVEGTGKDQARQITAYDGQKKVATVDIAWTTNPDDTSQYLIGPIVLTLSDYTRTDLNTPGQKKGLTAFEEIDGISIVYSPNAQEVQGLVDSLIEHCEILKDRFAIIDSEQGPLNERNVRDTKYAALYYPWIRIVDPEIGLTPLVPPGGHIAGIYARTDVERGVHKAPANEVVRGADSLEFTITKGEQDVLNPQGINCIRVFGGKGIRVWGARTLSSDASWKYVNVRRLFLYLEESIEEGTQWVVFEPNDERLWARVKQTITQFLARVWKDGALMGTTPEEAFYVKCDRTTMTQDDIENGRLIILIGVAPVKPAEFVIFRIAQWPGGSAVTE